MSPSDPYHPPTRAAESARAWPFELARLLRDRVEGQIREGKREPDAAVIFETGYGPSGLPHIGTFGEVVRTSMVRHAFGVLTDGRYPTRMICVSDDMDGMRKVPDTVPDPASLQEHLQKPLTRVPDPFGTHESYGAHMNARLCAFLDRFGFSYEFASATELYRSGVYDPMLIRTLERYQAIMDVMIPTLGEERQATYSPVLPISPTTGRVLYVPMTAVDPEAGTVTFPDEDGRTTTLPVTGGHCKLQWKPDFGMRWAALGVDFEMFGKDHQANAPVYSDICAILGGDPPVQYVYELFLDEQGQKISKTKGNGITIDDWLTYAPEESLALYMFQSPRKAKKLHFDVIPKAVDEYLTFLDKYREEDAAARLENPVWHIHSGGVPERGSPVSYALLINLVSAANATDRATLWGFIGQYAHGATPEVFPLTDRLAGYAIRYFEDFVRPTKVFRDPDVKERAAMQDLRDRLLAHTGAQDSDTLQTLCFDVGKAHAFENLRDWFKALYEVLLGQSQGPRFGSFIALFGVVRTADLIEAALARQPAS
jgi:lysyl-tRNA synthetase class 1